MKIKLFDGIALVVSLGVFLLFFLYGRGAAGDDGYLLVQDERGESVYTMSEDRTIVVEGPIGESVIEIHDGHAHFEHSDCQDQLCVQMGDITGGGEWAACLPNQVFIMIEGGDDRKEDVDVGVY